MEILIKWTSKYSVQSELIDKQHKKLCDMINELYDAFVNARAKEKSEKILKDMAEYAVYHFSTEEDLFERYNYSLTEEHKQEHQAFVAKVQEFLNKYQKGDVMLSYEIMNFLKDWLLNHILVSDHKYIDEVVKKMH
jgi:hemerythrin-like metal-binding protein